MNSLFCFGFGYCARALSEYLRKKNWSISGTTRKCGSTIRDLENIKAIHFDGTVPIRNFESVIKGTTHLLISIPPDGEGDIVLRHHGADIKRFAETIKWVGYLSTTGVYGNRDGGWVDETSALTPTTQRGKRRVMAEKQWLDMASEISGFPLHIFRLAGIYGPGRNAFLTLHGKKSYSIVKKGQFFSRIHQRDICSTLLASMAMPNPGSIYNLCDDEAAPPQDVLAYAARISHFPPLPHIPFEEAVDRGMLSSMARSFYAESKKVDNRKIKKELGVVLQYPTYKHGLDALWKEMRDEKSGRQRP